MNTLQPFGSPLYVMLKPAGPLCNLACKYCYYLEKQKLSPQNNSWVISNELLEEYFLVGISIDGPQEFHDEYRRSRSGAPSWREVMRGIRLL